VAGRAFNLGGGPANAVSLRRVIAFIGELTGRPVEARYAEWRAGDQRYYVSDTRPAARHLGLGPARPWREGVSALADWLREEHAVAARERAAAEAVP
jgi:CDP-paratose 2-epimerase